jgi:hypothetical protein
MNLAVQFLAAQGPFRALHMIESIFILDGNGCTFGRGTEGPPNLLLTIGSALKPETHVKKSKADAKTLEKRAADKAARKTVCTFFALGPL